MGVTDELNQSFPQLHDCKLIEELSSIGKILVVPKGTTILDEGQYIEYVPLLLEGLIKVKRKNKIGQEAFLYYIKRGETCAMTLSSCFKRQTSRISAKAVLDSKILLVPTSRTFFFMKAFQNWSEFVTETFQNKFDDAINAMDRFAFMNSEEQILDLLKRKKNAYGSNELKITHDSIAQDLSTSRVLVSRILKKLEYEGKIKLGHKSIIFK